MNWSQLFTPLSRIDKNITFLKNRVGGDYIETESIKINNYSGDIVHQVQIEHTKLDDVYRVRAEHVYNNGMRIVSSPKIQIKRDTIQNDKLLTCHINKHGFITLSWRNAKYLKPMIYFLAVDDEIKSYAAIYTRELAWTYPNFNKASLAIKINPKNVLIKGNKYVARLLLVDYEGWVSHIAVKSFYFKKI